MLQLDRLKGQYRKDLYSYRKLASYSFRGEKGARSAYVIAACQSTEIVDIGFWNNENLVAQFSYQDVKSTGSRFMDGVRDIALETEAEKKVQKASNESLAKIVLYANEGEDMVYGDLIFYNQSKNRALEKMTIIVGGAEETTMEELISFHASSGRTSFEDVVYLAFGSFCEFRKHFLGNNVKIIFNWEEDENDEAKDYLSMSFDLKNQLADYYAVKYIVDNMSWMPGDKEKIIPFLEEKMSLNDQRQAMNSSLNQVDQNASKIKKGGCLGSIIIFIIYFTVFELTNGDLGDGLMAIFIIGMIVPTVIGLVTSRTRAQKGKDSLSVDVALLDHDETALDERIIEAGL